MPAGAVRALGHPCRSMIRGVGGGGVRRPHSVSGGRHGQRLETGCRRGSCGGTGSHHVECWWDTCCGGRRQRCRRSGRSHHPDADSGPD
jgi:hypothetical protein